MNGPMRLALTVLVVLALGLLAIAAYVRPQNASYQMQDSNGNGIATVYVDVTQNLIDVDYDPGKGPDHTQIYDTGSPTPTYKELASPSTFKFRYERMSGPSHPNCYTWTQYNNSGGVIATGSMRDHSSIEP